ncbi:MAG: adenylate/guanylate cyclase domain-containing protein [Pseudomonadota bacterium]
MKCSKCQADNPETRKFCRECGAKLLVICPQCGSENLPGDKFCGECGHNLTIASEPTPKDLSFDEKLDKIQRYLPKGLTEKILAQRGKIEGERKQVTVMFCDMEGFTGLVERLGPEEAYAIMDQVYEILIHKVHDYEGTVNEMTGDGIMALFGAPIALEDAPQRAIRSAHAIHREMVRFTEKMNKERPGSYPLRMRIGIHTGPVVVGTLGNNLRVEFKAVGDTVNLASRMEGLAEPGTTYVTGETFELTEGLFRFEALGKKEIKGKEEPVKIYRVIAPSTLRTRFDVSTERGLTPFVGRERELELLLDGFKRAKQGRGQAFSVVAEAGVGKSRFLYEFRKAVANEDVTFLEGKCLSYSRGVAYHPVIDVLKSNFDVREEDGDFEIVEKVKRGLKVLDVDEDLSAPYLLELLSVKDSGIDKIPMSPEARKDRITEAVKRITLKGSDIRPLIVAVEDLHWIDRSSEEYLKHLLDSISGAKVFLILTYRPEFVHTWGGRSYHSQITLNRLSNRESLTMVSHLLGTENIAHDLEDLILEKTEGIPYFIEEFVKSLKDLKVIEGNNNEYHLIKDVQNVTIPSTIQDVIMARVDSMPEGAKEVLQTGTVIEREFSYELIKRVMGIPQEELLSHLSILKDSELIYERGIYPKSTYIFKHALTREVVYDSILGRRKKKLHSETGQAIEELYGGNNEEHLEILADHFIKGEDYVKGAQYSRLASKKAQKSASFVDSIFYAEEQISCLEKLPVTADVQKQIIDVRSILGLYFTQISDFVRAKEAVNPIIELAQKSSYNKRLSQIYTVVGTYNYAVEEDFVEAFRQFEEAIKISEERKDFVSLLLANYWMGVARLHNCEFEKALYHIERAHDINVAANSLWGISTMKSNLSGIYDGQGKTELGYQTALEALHIAEESGDSFSKAMSLYALGLCLLSKGFMEEVEKHLLMAIDLSDKIDFFWGNFSSHGNLGKFYFTNGEYQKSEDHFSQAVSILEKIGYFPSLINLYKLGIERARVMKHEKAYDLKGLYKFSDENKLRIHEGLMARYISEILLNIDDQYLSEAEDWIKKAVEADKRNGMMWSLARDYAFAAELFRRKGNESKAKKTLTNAIEIFKECGADGWVGKYEKELAALS